MSQLPRNVVGVGGTAAAAALALAASKTLLAYATSSKRPLHPASAETPPPAQALSGARAAPPAAPAPRFAWAVFWDLENVSVPRGVPGDAVVHALRHRLCTLRSSSVVVRIVAAGNVLRLPAALRNQLQANGVTLIHVDTRGRKDAADKALISELCLLPAEHPPPYGVALVSGDGDFSYALARVRHLGYHTVVVASTKGHMCSALLESVPHVVWGLKEDVLDSDFQQENGILAPGCAELTRLRRRVDGLTRDVADVRRAHRVKGEAKVLAVETDRKGAKKKRARKKKQQYVQRAPPDAVADGTQARTVVAPGPVVQVDKPGHLREAVADEADTTNAIPPTRSAGVDRVGNSRDAERSPVQDEAQPVKKRENRIALLTVLKRINVPFMVLAWCIALSATTTVLQRSGLSSMHLPISLQQGELLIGVSLFVLMYITRMQATSYEMRPVADFDNDGERIIKAQ